MKFAVKKSLPMGKEFDFLGTISTVLLFLSLQPNGMNLKWFKIKRK